MTLATRKTLVRGNGLDFEFRQDFKSRPTWSEKNKKTLNLSIQCRKDIADLFRESYEPITKWLKGQIILNRSKIGTLSKKFSEAGVDKYWCQFSNGDETWSGDLHKIWHEIHGTSCSGQ